MHYYGFHIKDYRAKTAHLTPLEHYVYRTLIDWYYLSEKPFCSVEQIARYLLLPLNDENTQAIKNVLGEFFNFCKGKYHHRRINKEIKDFKAGKYTLDGNGKDKKDNATDNETVTENNGKGNGKGKGKPLSDNERQARYKERKKMLKALLDKGLTVDGNASFDDVVALYYANFSETVTQNHGRDNATDNETVTENNGKNEAITNNHKPLTNNQSNISPQTPQGAGVIEMGKTNEKTKATAKKTNPTSDTDKTLNVPFETFWDAYDKKIDPKKCKPLWERLSDKDRLDIMAYLPKYKQSQPDKQYRKNPQTFLNARSWESEIITATPQQPQFGTPADPLAVNDYWENHYTPPPNRDENLKIAMARLANPQAQPTGMIEI